MNGLGIKICPLCAERIKAAAKLCPYCKKSQTRWGALTRGTSLAVLAALLLLGGFGLVALFLIKGHRFAFHHRDVVVVSSHLTEEIRPFGFKYTTNLMVVGMLTNRGSYKWRLGDFEVRIFDGNGELADVTTAWASDPFTLLPRSEHAYRLALYRKPSPQFASVEVTVRSAKSPQSQ